MKSDYESLMWTNIGNALTQVMQVEEYGEGMTTHRLKWNLSYDFIIQDLRRAFFQLQLSINLL